MRVGNSLFTTDTFIVMMKIRGEQIKVQVENQKENEPDSAI